MKRITVLKMLNKRLSESKHSINVSHQYEDMVNVLGGDNSKEKQHRINMQNDINELEYLITCLKERNKKPLDDIEFKEKYDNFDFE
jgi:hypothetical protein